mmetsp:Transcript_47073/g.134778  ORF Transcript_47073/g.134778 Transcript_47073/m.134778 type:complete len:195 (-) Transcript_47073:28-612(-)
MHGSHPGAGTDARHPGPFEPLKGGGGFISHHGDCRPHKHPETALCPNQKFFSYGEWFEAHRRPDPQEHNVPTKTTKPSNFWPYGPQVTSLTTTDKEGVFYNFDHRHVRNVIPERPVVQFAHSHPLHAASPVPLRHSGSSPALFGAHSESHQHLRRTMPQQALRPPRRNDAAAMESREAPKFIDKIDGKSPTTLF